MGCEKSFWNQQNHLYSLLGVVLAMQSFSSHRVDRCYHGSRFVRMLSPQTCFRGFTHPSYWTLPTADLYPVELVGRSVCISRTQTSPRLPFAKKIFMRGNFWRLRLLSLSFRICKVLTTGVVYTRPYSSNIWWNWKLWLSDSPECTASESSSESIQNK